MAATPSTQPGIVPLAAKGVAGILGFLLLSLVMPARSETPAGPRDSPVAATASETRNVPAQEPPTPPKAAVPAAVVEQFNTFILALWPEAAKRGVSRGTFERALAGLAPDGEIFGLLANQPEHVAAPWDYMGRLVSQARIENGRQKLAEHGATLSAVEAAYGIDRHIVLAIWGIESSYGAGTGMRMVPRSLATLAVGDPRRPEFWKGELLSALLILERGDIAPELMTGSWAGAMGHTQFMPSSYMAHAVDFDGDKRRDIWGSVPDALASTANYLKVAGWRSGEPWGFEVVLPAGFEFALSAPGVTKPLAEWKALGLMAPAGREWPAHGAAAQLVLPAGARGPAFLTLQNFKAILRYNHAVAYALAVGHLADRLGGAPAIAGLWPTDDPPLAKAEREELQRRLAALGHDPGGADGVIGAKTRAAIRAFQRLQGLPEDGYASQGLIERVRGETGPDPVTK